MCKKIYINNITLKNPVYLDYDLYSMQIGYTSVHKLETLQAIVIDSTLL